MEIAIAALAGFVIDLLLGDPAWLVHPVVIMGRCISRLEKLLRRVFPATPAGERTAGTVMAVLLPVGTYCLAAGIIWLCGRVHPALRWIPEILWSWQVLAMRDLEKESMAVSRALRDQGLEQARKAVSRIVGRDTERLDRDGVIRAAVETVAENFSDGEIAPLLYLLIGGAPLALAYKAINTMDSMVGYKNERYLHYGRTAARLDDAANYVPSRLAAVLLVLAAPVCGGDGGNAFRIWRRDRRNHASPNSAQTESAMAGALHIRLGGPAWYFGEYHDKPTIGDADRSIETEDIARANRIMMTAGILGLALMTGLRILICGI